MSGWLLRYNGFDPRSEGLREALCALGNGRFMTRGAAPESMSDDVHSPSTYAAGVFNRLADDIAGRHIENESIVNLPDWQSLSIRPGRRRLDSSRSRPRCAITSRNSTFAAAY